MIFSVNNYLNFGLFLTQSFHLTFERKHVYLLFCSLTAPVRIHLIIYKTNVWKVARIFFQKKTQKTYLVLLTEERESYGLEWHEGG